MCQLQELVSNENGYVIRCSECFNYQVLFSTTLLSLSAEEFNFFRKQVIQQQESGWTNPYSEKILIATPKTGVHLILSPIEFDQLQQMLEAAEVEAEALQLLQLFNQ